MKQIIFLIFIFSPLFIFGQPTDDEKANKFLIGFTISSDYAYRSLKSESSSQWYADIRDRMESPKFGFTTGFNFIFFRKRFAAEAGLLFADKGYKRERKLMDVNGNAIGRGISRYHYEYIDIPLKLHYNIKTGSSVFFITGGISTNFFLRQRVVASLQFDDGSAMSKRRDTVKEGYPKLNLAVIAGLGYRQRLSDKLYFQIEPVYRRSAISIIDAPIKGYLWSFGADMGLFYGF